MIPENTKFIASLVSGAKATQKLYGVPASVTIAQAILESGWGKSGLTKKANNLFGIKADKSWKGEVCIMPTTEYFHGKKMTVNAPFRKYPTLADSLFDHGYFLKRNPRYKPAFKCANGPDFANKIAACNYATDPSYGDLLVVIIKHNHLEQYDGQLG